jgi:hypothetical protein
MTFATLVEEIRALPREQRKTLITLIVDSLTEPESSSSEKPSLLDFRGVAAHLRDMDAQEYINQLRDEWDQPK